MNRLRSTADRAAAEHLESFGSTPAHLAAYFGDNDELESKLLVQENLSILKITWASTPLHYVSAETI